MPLLRRSCLALIAVAVVLTARAQQPPAQPAPGQPSPLPTNPQAQPAAQTPASDGAQEVTLRLPDADLDTILRALEIYTGKVILRPAALPTATYNIKIEKPVPKAAAIRYLETVLALNGIAILPLDDGAYKVTASTMARMEAPELITGSTLDLAPSGRVASKLFQLEFVRAQEAQQMLQSVLNVNYGGTQPLVNANAFLITDSISNLQRVETLLQQIDRPFAAGMKPKFYQLRNGAKASDVVNKLRTIITGALLQQVGSATSYSADDRTNQIILVTDPRQHAFFDELIEQLDQRADPNTRNDVIQLNHAKAADVAQVLIKVIQGQNQAVQSARQSSVRPGSGLQGPTPGTPSGAPNQPNQPTAPNIVSGSTAGSGLDALLSGSSEFSGVLTIVNDDRTNSIVVSGTADDLRLLRDLVAKLDIVLAQVRIEVVIAEVSLADNDQSGISSLGLQIEGDKLVGFGLAAAGMSVTGPAGGESLATLTRPGTTGRWDLAGLISLGTTPRKTNATILSQPSIVTSHGKVSEIFSGESRPVVTGSVTSGTIGGTTSTTQQLRIGTRLNVTPFIGADGSVQLELKQTVEDVVDEVIIDGNPQPIIGTRETTSYITAKSGDIVVLGGFRKATGTRTSNRLGPIPIIGEIFGSRRKTDNRQELIFFLRPMVLTNTAAIDNAPAMQQLERMPNRESVKEALDLKPQVPAKRSALDRILPR